MEKIRIRRRPTLRAAAKRLHEVAQKPPVDGWAETALPAVRTAIVALEKELDTLHAPDTTGETLTQEAPRLIHQAQQLQAQLAEELVTLWELKETGVSTQEQVEAAAQRLAALGRQSLDLTWEAARPAEALD